MFGPLPLAADGGRSVGGVVGFRNILGIVVCASKLGDPFVRIDGSATLATERCTKPATIGPLRLAACGGLDVWCLCLGVRISG